MDISPGIIYPHYPPYPSLVRSTLPPVEQIAHHAVCFDVEVLELLWQRVLFGQRMSFLVIRVPAVVVVVGGQAPDTPGVSQSINESNQSYQNRCACNLIPRKYASHSDLIFGNSEILKFDDLLKLNAHNVHSTFSPKEVKKCQIRKSTINIYNSRIIIYLRFGTTYAFK